MKSATLFLLPVAVQGAVIGKRIPQIPGLPSFQFPDLSKLPPLKLGPNGLPDLTGLQGFDLARFGPAIANMQPYFASAANTGAIAKFMSMLVPTTPLKNKVLLEPKLRKGAKRVKSRLGPYTLVAKGEKRPPWFSYGTVVSLDPSGQSFVGLVDASSFCQNCTVLSGQSGLEFANGSSADPANGVYIHHILSFDLSREGRMTVLPCDFEKFNYTETPLSPVTPGAAFVGQGEDNGDSAIMFTSRDGKFDSGFQVGADDKFMVQADLVNYNPQPIEVYITFDLEYVDGHVGVEAAPNLLSVTGCKLAEPKISKDGPAETVSQKFPVLVDGTLVSMKGHLHNGGERMITYLNDKEICTSEATYDDKQVLSGMTSCDQMIPVKKGDVITVKSIYDIVKHPMRSGAHGGSAGDIIGGHDVMGMMTMSIAMSSEKKPFT